MKNIIISVIQGAGVEMKLRFIEMCNLFGIYRGWRHSDPNLGINSFCYYIIIFSESLKHSLHVDCQIWMWFKEYNMFFLRSNISLIEKKQMDP